MVIAARSPSPGLHVGDLQVVACTGPSSVSFLTDALTATAIWREWLHAYRDLLKLKRESFWTAKVDAERSSPRQLWQSIDALMGRGHPVVVILLRCPTAALMNCTVSLMRRSPVFAGRRQMHRRRLSYRRRLVARFLVSSRWTSTT